MDTITFKLEEVIDAISIIWRGNEKKESIEEADRYLKKFQKSSEVWTITNQILLIPNDVNDIDGIYFFAAKFLHTKLSYDFEQLPKNENEYRRLATLITSTFLNFPWILFFITIILTLDSLKEHKCKGKGIFEQLCLAFVDLYLQTYYLWNDLVSYLVDNFGNENDFQHLLFKILTVIKFCIVH